ncbi:hypothetical protein LTR39_005113, partial [Cryomyces antarcticus]
AAVFVVLIGVFSNPCLDGQSNLGSIFLVSLCGQDDEPNSNDIYELGQDVDNDCQEDEDHVDLATDTEAGMSRWCLGLLGLLWL